MKDNTITVNSEIAQLTLADGSVCSGQVLEISGSKAVVQVRSEGHLYNSDFQDCTANVGRWECA